MLAHRLIPALNKCFAISCRFCLERAWDRLNALGGLEWRSPACFEGSSMVQCQLQAAVGEGRSAQQNIDRDLECGSQSRGPFLLALFGDGSLDLIGLVERRRYFFQRDPQKVSHLGPSSNQVRVDIFVIRCPFCLPSPTKTWWLSAIPLAF